MKNKITRKIINENYTNVYNVGRCGISDFYQSEDAKYYNCGIYGWNYDVYEIGGIAVLEGDRGTFGKPLPKTCVKIIEKFRKIRQDLPWGELEKVRGRAKKRFEKALIEDAMGLG